MRGMSTSFPPWHVDEVWLLPPSVQDLVPAGHVAHFVRDAVRDGCDLAPLMEAYAGERDGPAFHPGMMTALLLYAYSQGIHSSRQIARACVDRLDFAAVTGLQRPDFQAIADFRKRHASILLGLFVHVLRLSHRIGLPRLGDVTLHRKPGKAGASKPASATIEAALSAVVRGWLAEAARSDRRRTRGDDGDGQPEWFADRTGRRAKIRQARAALEAEEHASGSARGSARRGRRPGRAAGSATPDSDAAAG